MRRFSDGLARYARGWIIMVAWVVTALFPIVLFPLADMGSGYTALPTHGFVQRSTLVYVHVCAAAICGQPHVYEIGNPPHLALEASN